MAAIYSNGGNHWNILGFSFNKRDALSSVYKISMGQANFTACPVWMHTQSNITKIIFLYVYHSETKRGISHYLASSLFLLLILKIVPRMEVFPRLRLKVFLYVFHHIHCVENEETLVLVLGCSFEL
jgi:hypothetical protein